MRTVLMAAAALLLTGTVGGGQGGPGAGPGTPPPDPGQEQRQREQIQHQLTEQERAQLQECVEIQARVQLRLREMIRPADDDAAVEEGRIIYDNIKKYLTFLLSCNVAEILILGIAGIIGWEMPLIALQILWVNLTTDGLPALALGLEPAEPDLMGRPPRDPNEPVFSGAVLWALSAMSILIFIGLMPIFYWYWQNEGVEKAQTMALATLVVYELFYAFNCRSLRFTLPQLGFFSNKWLLPAVLSSGLLTLAVIYIPSCP